MLRRASKNQVKKSNESPSTSLILHSLWLLIFFAAVFSIIEVGSVKAQGPVNGSFVGRVTEVSTNAPIANATVTFKNIDRGFQTAAKTDSNGNFSRTALPPGNYEISVNADGYAPQTKTQSLYATRSNEVVPVPFVLAKAGANQPTDPNTQNSPTGSTTVKANTDEDTKVTLNPRRDGAFDTFSLMNLPLGGTTLTRTFDELALLIPGVNPPPQAIGNTVGPGVGGGVGTSGQFSVNGLRSRANNFMVDGSDNNDEDIGVRRQGFFSLVPQPIESVQEFQIITLLAPAQYGRNLGAQVNALSRSGTNRFSGSVFGLFNSDRLNSTNYFDTTTGNTTINLTGVRSSGSIIPVFLNTNPIQVSNLAGEKDEFSLFQGGLAFGGPIVKNKMFFFVSGEGQSQNGTSEKSFAVPTVEERGLFRSGVSGLQQCPINPTTGNCVPGGDFVPGFPTSLAGDAVFSLFPFPNNPNGVYGRNTYTQALSTDARGFIASGKFDYNFEMRNRPQSFTARYNFTNDKRNLTDVGGALFSAIRPLVRTDNFSAFWSGGITDRITNEVRVSWGRTRLRFEELKDTTGFILPVTRVMGDTRFLLNARLLANLTFPTGCTPTGCFAPLVATYGNNFGTTENSRLGPIGQLIIAGYSPVGVDVFNFPQQRVNNTLQFADTMRWQINEHSLAFGADIRYAILESDLPRNARSLVTFNGGIIRNSPQFVGTQFIRPIDLAASNAATGFFQTLVLPNKNAQIELNYTQFNFFIQDEWRVRPNFNLSFGLRYEFNTPPSEANNKIEETFGITPPSFLSGLTQYIDGRTKIFDGDYNNFAPRIGFAYSPNKNSVIRGGYGLYYDQAIGAVVSQSRNVFPTFITANFGGGILVDNGSALGNRFTLFNPIDAVFDPVFNFVCNRRDVSPACVLSRSIPLIQPGTLNTINPQLTAQQLQAALLDLFFLFPNSSSRNGSSFGATLPTRELEMPMSHQFFIGVEQKIFRDNFLSVSYVGTIGRNLLRFTTPNLGANYISEFRRVDLDPSTGDPVVRGNTLDPTNGGGRIVSNVGTINQFETTGESRYDSLQIELRGRLMQNFQYRASYVYSRAKDDVSDVFDLAGAFALPQNSRPSDSEYSWANFDIRNRVTFNFIYELPKLENRNNVVKYIFGNWQVSGTGKFYTGQPFTVNTIFDVNFDGNLTDRLNNTSLITQNNRRQQPLSLACSLETTCLSMLAPFGQDGSVPRNSFRTGDVLNFDVSFSKRFKVTEIQNLLFRIDVFNLTNRANFGVPVRFLEFPSFGRATETITPGRRIQFLVRYNF